MKYHIGVLDAKCLIKIDSDRWQKKSVTLHDLIEDMGKEIVRHESPEDPGLRSRLWLREDIIQVFKENKGTDKIQILIMGSYTRIEEWDGKAFKKMENLKTLIVEGHCFVGVPQHLPNSLRVLEWERYPSPSLPFGSHPEKLTILKLRKSCLTSLGLFKIEKKFLNMRVLEFNYSNYITQIPDLSGVPNLEELTFGGCGNLIKIDESVGFLDKLRILNAGGCCKLRYFPPLKLTSLEKLNLYNCRSLEKFPEILGKMENITKLDLGSTPIKELPFSIQNLTQLKGLWIEDCRVFQLPGNKICFMFPSLENLDISVEYFRKTDESSPIYDECFPALLSSLANLRLRRLSLPYHGFTFVPACITKLHSLRELCLDFCYHLLEIRWIPPNLESLDVRYCESLKYLDLTASPCLLRTLNLENCRHLEEIRGIPPTIQVLTAIHCTSLTDSSKSILLNQELHEEVGNMLLSLPGSMIPEWFEHRSTGHSHSFWFRGKFPAISACLAIRLEDVNHISLNICPKLNINGNTVNGPFEFCEKFLDGIFVRVHHIFIFDIKLEDNVDELVLLENEWNHAELSFYELELSENEWKHSEVSYDTLDDDDECFATQTGFHVFKQGSSMEDIRFTIPSKKKES
ncbi:hypothetical protein RIF29_06288 [Crotalaria pallida]|uniref:Disease resistance protein RPS4B/Roq1-like leucine-rich repeats domain-containing protein n=1 Tax=Crotalaria pallida TaxID=3830 RepID=A0AAN9J5N1_CROPI